MELFQDIVSWAFFIAGGAMLLIGGLGLIRLPDFYTRLHAGGIIDTLGAELVLAGMIVQAGFTLVAVKLILIGLFIFFTSPTSTHAIANAAFVVGMPPRVDEEEEGESSGS